MKADIVVCNRGYWNGGAGSAEGMIDLMEPFRRRDIYHWRVVGEMSDPAELARLRKALLGYCRQDTLGLVRLVEKLRSLEG